METNMMDHITECFGNNVQKYSGKWHYIDSIRQYVESKSSNEDSKDGGGKK